MPLGRGRLRGTVPAMGAASQSPQHPGVCLLCLLFHPGLLENLALGTVLSLPEMGERGSLGASVQCPDLPGRFPLELSWGGGQVSTSGGINGLVWPFWRGHLLPGVTRGVLWG